ncbi:unnamed protein product, partial [Mesorhabditis spiculigera]
MADQHQDNERRVSMREQFRLQEELEAAKEKLEKQDKKLEDLKAMLEDSQAHNRNLAVERNIARCDMDHATYERNRELRKACFELLMTDRVPEGWPGTRKWEEDNRKKCAGENVPDFCDGSDLRKIMRDMDLPYRLDLHIIAAVASAIYLLFTIMSLVGACKKKGSLLIPTLLVGIVEIFIGSFVLLYVVVCLEKPEIDRAQIQYLRQMRMEDNLYEAKSALILVILLPTVFELIRVILALFLYFESKFAAKKSSPTPTSVPLAATSEISLYPEYAAYTNYPAQQQY